jgi:hypothetical protein
VTDVDPQADPATPTIMMVEVVNKNDFEIKDMFNGVPVVFPPDEAVPVQPEVAMHCFGYPGDDEERSLHCAKRFGWSGRDYLKPAGLGQQEALYVTLTKKIVIRPIYYDLVRRSPDDPVPLDTGDEADDRPRPPPESAKGTRVGKRRGSRAKNDRHRVAPMRLGAR